MQELFELGGFVLRKWKSSEPVVLAQIPHEPVDSQSTQFIDIDHFTKVLSMEWNGTFISLQCGNDDMQNFMFYGSIK